MIMNLVNLVFVFVAWIACPYVSGIHWDQFPYNYVNVTNTIINAALNNTQIENLECVCDTFGLVTGRP